MKVILSRKGWDSRAGGRASPIFPSGELLSVPIPENPGTPYGSISTPRLSSLGISSVGQFLKAYWSSAPTEAHLDPDLDFGARPRLSGWTPCFGQAGAAASHLDTNGVGIGDLFLFYGWFDNVTLQNGGKWRRTGNDAFVVWGWLQIGEILRPPVASWPAWVATHPHAIHGASYPGKNRIYVAATTLAVPGVSPRPGSGIFSRVHPNRNLTSNPGLRGLFPDKLPANLNFSKHRQEHVSASDCADLETWLQLIFA